MTRVIFGFSRPLKFNLLSTTIEKIESRPFSHVYMRFADPTSQKEVVFQASGLAVNLCLFDVFLLKELPIEEYEFPLKDDEGTEFWLYVLEKLGTPYSILQLFSILFNKITGLYIGRNGSNAEICSELGVRTSRMLGISVPMNADYATPSDFNKFCKQTMQRIK